MDIEKFRIKRGPGRPPSADPMQQISIRLPSALIARIDAIIEHERYGQGDRATIIREAIAKYVNDE